MTRFDSVMIVKIKIKTSSRANSDHNSHRSFNELRKLVKLTQGEHQTHSYTLKMIDETTTKPESQNRKLKKKLYNSQRNGTSQHNEEKKPTIIKLNTNSFSTQIVRSTKQQRKIVNEIEFRLTFPLGS